MKKILGIILALCMLFSIMPTSVFAATEIGIQTIRSYGPVDVILANPNNEAVKQIEFDDNGFLVAKTNNKIYKRKICNKKRADYNTQTNPVCSSYYD